MPAPVEDMRPVRLMKWCDKADAFELVADAAIPVRIGKPRVLIWGLRVFIDQSGGVEPLVYDEATSWTLAGQAGEVQTKGQRRRR